MIYARVVDGYVVEIIDPLMIDGIEVPIEDRFTPDLVAQMVVYDPENPPEAPPPVTAPVEQRIAALRSAISSHLDAGALTKGYDNIINAALRAAYPGPYHDEGMAFATWMDACWFKAYELLAQWQAGELAEPTPEELINLLPPLELP